MSLSRFFTALNSIKLWCGTRIGTSSWLTASRKIPPTYSNTADSSPREDTTVRWELVEGKIVEEQSWTHDVASANAGFIRRLSTIESYQLALQSLDHMRRIILAYRYRLPTRLLASECRHEIMTIFERAVAWVVLKHPNLRIGIFGKHTSSPSWIYVERIDLRDHIEWIQVVHGAETLQYNFQDICNEELDTKFTNFRTRPGWRLKVLHQDGSDSIEVILALNHTNMDGSSATIFHADLLQRLQDDPKVPEDGSLRDHILTLPDISCLQLSPPAQDLVSFPVDPKAMSYYIQNELRTSAAQYPRTSTQAHWAPITTSPFKTQFRTINISKDILEKLVQACRQHDTTLTGLLHALALVALAPILGPSRAPAFDTLTAMDLRRFLPTHPPLYPWFDPQSAMNNYVTIQNHIFDEDFVTRLHSLIAFSTPQSSQSGALMDHIWTAARKVRGELQAKLDQGLENDMNGFAQVVEDWRAQLSKEAQRPRRTSWVVTNLGSINGNPVAASSDVKQENTWEVTRAQFIMCANVVASAIGISTAAVKGRELIITCSWQDCVIDRKIGEAFVASLETWLNLTSTYAERLAGS